jgi:hypothetical protein
VHLTGDGHLRLTGSTEAALTPALRGEVEAARQELVALLASEVGRPADAATGAHPVLLDPAAPATTSLADNSSGLPGWLVWGGLAVVVAALGAAYLLGRAAASAPEAPSPAPLPAAWPYGGQSWNW